MTKRETIKKLDGRTVTVTALNWRDNAETRKALKLSVESQGFNFDDVCNETETAFEFSNGQFVFKETRPRETEQVVHVSSGCFRLGSVRCEYRDFKVTDANRIESANTRIEWAD